MSRKIELMHELFGACVGKKCGQCGHLVESGTHQKKYFKCEVMGTRQAKLRTGPGAGPPA